VPGSWRRRRRRRRTHKTGALQKIHLNPIRPPLQYIIIAAHLMTIFQTAFTRIAEFFAPSSNRK
jgi:hypothetical protein